ncbi:SIRT3 [Symbiodinium sp. CCMP2456]|nr:SIRT3 [Symbiodinium sp. CCMP2456]
MATMNSVLSPDQPPINCRSSSTGPCLDIENLLDPELKKRLGEPLERPLRAARPQSPHEAQLMSELYARIAQKCGKPLLDEVAGTSHAEKKWEFQQNVTRV